MSIHAFRSAVRAVVLLGSLLTVSVGVAGATPLGQITEFTSGLNPGNNVGQLRAGPDGNLWLADRAGAIGRITPDGAITEYSSGLNPGSSDQTIALGPDGNMWFTDNGTIPAIGVINPTTHAISEFSTGLNAGSVPRGITMGPDGNLWFTDQGTTKAIGMINPTTHAISEFTSGLNSGSSPYLGLTTGPDGNLWFTDQGTTKAIGRINPATHAITEFSNGLNAGGLPGPSIAAGPDGNLWFTDTGTTHAIGRIDPTTGTITEFSNGLIVASPSLGRLAVGPDGNIWFADRAPGIGMLNPTTHAITEFTTGLNAGSLPGGIGPGPDGNVWFTDQGTTIRAIGRAGTGAPVASLTPPSVVGTRGVGVPQTCGGDTWSSWAGQQPSRSAFGFDGYRWLLDGNAIAGASGASYTPTAAQAGHQLSCEVTATYELLQVTVSAASVSAEVSGAAEQLSELAARVTGVGPGKSLARKQAVIESAVSAGKITDACAELIAFGHELNAQSGKTLDTAEASALLARVHGINAALGC
jgi:streptogramin lyase